MAAVLHPLHGLRLLLIAAALVVVAQGVSAAREVLVGLLVAVFLSALATPPLLWLQRRRVPPAVSVAIVITAMVVVLAAAGVIVGTSINAFYATIPSYQARLAEHLERLRTFFAGQGYPGIDKVLLGYVNPGSVMNLTAGLLAGIGAALSNIVLIVLTVTFILLEASSFPIKLRAVLGDPRQAFPQFTVFVAGMERYMVIKTIISLATGGLVGLWLWVLGVDFPILWGFVAFLLNYVPSVGSTVASVPALLLAFIQFGAGRAALVAVGYMTVNLVLDYAIETRLMGRRLGLSTLVVFLSLLLWGSLLGPVGMVLCIPLTMTLKFACENHEGTEWIALLLGPEVPPGVVPRAANARPAGRVDGAAPSP